MNKNTSVVGVTTLIAQTPHETALEKINTIILPKISAEKTEKERQERSKQLQKCQKYFLEQFIEIVSCIFNLDPDCPSAWGKGGKVVELCTVLSIEEIIAFEKGLPRHPIIKPALGFFAPYLFWGHVFPHLIFGCGCDKCKIFLIVKDYFSFRKEFVRRDGEKAIEETLKEWHALIANEREHLQRKEKTKIYFK